MLLLMACGFKQYYYGSTVAYGKTTAIDITKINISNNKRVKRYCFVFVHI